MGLKIDRKAQKITKAIGLVVLAIILICLIKITFWEREYYQSKSSETRNPEQSVITRVEDPVAPSEIAPSDVDIKKHQTAATAPRYLEIERLELKSRIVESNVNEHILPLPSNIYDIAWYSGSSRPGYGGNIFMAGISTGLSGNGALKNLDSLEKGDIIKIERGDGTKLSYEVQIVKIVDHDAAEKELPEAQKRIDDKETLALITSRRVTTNNEESRTIVIVRATKK